MASENTTIRSNLLPEIQKAYAEGNLARCEKLCLLQLQYSPQDVEAKFHLGVVYSRTRRVDQGIDLLTEIQSTAPSYAAAFVLYALYFGKGEIDLALDSARQAIELDPSEVTTYLKVGKDLVKLGRLDLACEFLRLGVENTPHDTGIRVELAQALERAGDREAALEAWAAVTRLNSNLAPAWIQLGRLQMSCHRFLGALESGKKAIKCAPSEFEAYMLTGLASMELARADEAGSYFQKALRLKPDSVLAKASLASTKYESGDFEAASILYKETLETWPTNGHAYYTNFRSRKVTEDDRETMAAITRLTRREDIAALDRSFLEYSLGKAYEDLQDYESAIAHYDLANEVAFKHWRAENPWNPELYKQNISRIVETFDSKKIDSLRINPVESKTPILVVGMLRSGTTLLEHILASHPEITGAGELTFWTEHLGAFANIAEGSVDVDGFRNAALRYDDLLREFDPSAKRVIDKLPHNYVNLGFVHPILPNARIIHIRRNPIDNCFSIYATAFSQPPEFALVRENIVTVYAEYLKLMEHWRKVLPADRFIEIDYECLIANKESELRRLIAFLGLDWDEALLHHEQNTRVVRTPSAWQVRQPLYSSSIGRWKHFEPWIAPFDQLPSAHPPLSK